MKLTAVIPIRKGSQRVPAKNYRPFAGTTLMQIKIDNLKKSGIFDEIIVNTDSEEAIEIAKANNITFQKREGYFASSECTGSEYFMRLAEMTDTDLFAYCPVTSPFIGVGTMKACKELFEATPGCDCVSTVSNVKDFLWQNGKAINYDPFNAPNSQDLPDIKALNFGFTIVKRDTMLKNRNIIGDHPQFITTSEVEAVDIDTPLDFFMAESLYRKLVLEGKGLLD